MTNLLPAETKNAVELALLTAGQPLDIRALKRALGANATTADVKHALDALRQEWDARAMQLVESASGYQLISRLEYADTLRRLAPERPPRLSRSLMEVLAIIAYRQPATRGDIEQIRGIAVASNQIAFLEELGWIEEVGRRDTPGRPVLYATTNTFLDDLGLASLNDLPSLPQVEEDDMEEAMNASDGDDSGDGADAEDGDSGNDDSDNTTDGDTTEQQDDPENTP